MEKIFSKILAIRSNQRLKINLKDSLADLQDNRVLGYKQYLKKSNGKKALLSYLVDPVAEELSGIDTELFSNSGAGRTIPKVLNQLGYVVDVINWDDCKPIDGKFDLIIFHGGKNFEQIRKLKNANNKLVYYSTGSYWKFHNDEERKRFEYFEKRHNVKLKMDREIKDSEEMPNRFADAIISLGNKDTAKTYLKFGRVYSIEGASMPIKRPRKIFKPKNGQIGFLFLAGPGNIHKGLDIVLDTWKKLPKNYELHIITYLEDDFTKFYHKSLYESSNIYTHGYVPQRSKLFYKIINQCQYSILLSCSEGSPGSVIESMHQGLIPIVNKASHIGIPSQGILVDSIGIEKLVVKLKSLDVKSSKNVLEDQLAVRDWAEKRFSPTSYESNFVDIIGKIVK